MGIGVERERLLRLLEMTTRNGEKRDAEWREKVRGLLDADESALPSPGAPAGNQNAAKNQDQGGNKGSDTTFVGRGRAYNIARLKRDAPELAERVAWRGPEE